MSKRVDEAMMHFTGGLLCSQSILLAYGQQFGIDQNTAMRIARPFGGGMSRTCEVCGAVSGAIMVLGLQEQEVGERTAKENVYSLTQEFCKRFKERNGSVNCAQLLGCNLGTTEGQEYFRGNGLIQNCKKYVRDSAVILEELLDNGQHS